MTRDDGYTRYTVRIPTPLYERVKVAAGEASVNSLIVQLLEEKYPAPVSDADTAYQLRALFDLLAETTEAIEKKFKEFNETDDPEVMRAIKAGIDLLTAERQDLQGAIHRTLAILRGSPSTSNPSKNMEAESQPLSNKSFPTFHEDVPTWHEGDDAGDGPRSAGEGGPAVAGDTAPPKKTGRSQSPRPRVKKVRTK